MELVHIRDHNLRTAHAQDLPDCYYYEWESSDRAIYVPDGRLHFIWEDGAYSCIHYEDKAVEWKDGQHFVSGVCIGPQYEVLVKEEEWLSFFRQMVLLESFEMRRTYYQRNWTHIFHLNRVSPLIEQVNLLIIETKGRMGMETIASDLGYSTRQIEQVFRKQYGYGPKMYSRIVRLQETIERMKRYPRQTLAEIAEQTGYSDPSHFQREFRRFVGITPKQFKQQYIGDLEGTNL